MKIKITNYYETQSTLTFLSEEKALDYEEHTMDLIQSYQPIGIVVLDHLTNPLPIVKQLNDIGVLNIIVALSNEQLYLSEALLDLGITDLIWDAMPRRLVIKVFNNAVNMMFKKFVDHMNIMSVISDANEKIIYANPTFYHETGYDENDVIGNKTNILKSGKHSLMFYNNIKHTLKAGFPWGGMFVNKRKDQSMFKEKSYIFPFDLDGTNYYGKAAFNVTLEENIATENRQALELARIIQQSLLPDEVYEENITIRTRYEPLEHVSGDIYNIYPINEDLYAVFLADVVGHGIGSSLLSTSIIAIANDLVKTYYMPDAFLNRLNNKIMELFKSNELPQTSYFTAIYMIIDLKEHKVHYANCGHPSFYLKDAHGLQSLIKINFFIGMFQNAAFEYNTFSYESDCEIFLHTDGLNEFNKGLEEGDMLTEELTYYYNSHTEKPLIQHLEESIVKANRDKLIDDVTMIQIDLKRS
ncbi:MAG: SpoIIE family protein phosphatase [Clostridia bacterium]|nr:SpoIIE family protein phosphatase [Clostridia bacterium]